MAAMDEALFQFSTALALAGLVGQIIGLAMAKRGRRHLLVRTALLALWCGTLWFLFILLVGFNYCESGCSGRPVNGPTWAIHASWLVLNVGTLWLAFKGIGRLP
jgi:hypothetical protein